MHTQRLSNPFGHWRCWIAAAVLSLSPATAQETEPGPAATDPPPASQAGGEPAAQSRPGPAMRYMQLLAAGLPAPSVQWLEAGGERFLAVYESDYTGNPQGAILMLHAEGQHPAAHATLDAVRRQLPQYGWATLAAVLPSPGTAPIPARPPAPAMPATGETTSDTGPGESETGEREAGEQDNSGKETDAADAEETAAAEGEPTAAASESDEIFDDNTGEISDGRQPPAPDAEPAKPAKPVEQQVAERLQAALQFLQEQGIFNVVVLGHGVGAARAAEFYRQSRSPATGTAPDSATTPIRALLFVNARNRIPLTEVELADCFNDPALPVLDIYQDADPRNRAEAEQRRRQARRRGLQHFVQLRLPRQSASLDRDHNQLMRRIRGFLAKYAAGMEIGRAGQRP
ncbi:DUF3530 family protein [Exilibacterium tricleocarpae]|uniref:DUF3530 family protein n=1 Tax=Exilibacterium tricleocarpae TaxID=2591008 RepID=A0A545T3I6_9GAMM|nr:DUF3530 family protein [Exilibacterium tricleocarpae]TQV71783.1 DUF3530 family protein [Exilibacterium tricleocarpae]